MSSIRWAHAPCEGFVCWFPIVTDPGCPGVLELQCHLLFRAEEAGDIPAIRGMIATIMRPQTADLVDRIRGSDRYIPELSRVAVGDDGEIVGFVMLSRLDVLGDRPWSALTLAPLGISESHQRTGVGSSLTQEALRHADDLGEAVVVVLGHPSYYLRLGFVPATGIGIDPPEGADVPSEPWMAKPLTHTPPTCVALSRTPRNSSRQKVSPAF